MKAKILEILNCQSHTYEMQVFNLWLTWCQSKTNNSKSLQKALTSKPLFNWWKRELEKLEKDFVTEAYIYKDHLTYETALEFWMQSVEPIYHRFSKPLIKKINEK